MSTLGKVCLSIALFLWLLLLVPLPGIWGGWAPKLLIAQNEWATEIRDSREAAVKAIDSEADARRKLNKASTDVQVTTFGWDKFWTVPARGQGNGAAPTIAKQQGGRLKVTNLGSSHGIADATQQVNGQPQTVRPIIHAFYKTPNGETYAGEFTAMEIGPIGMTLVPVHSTPPQFVNTWDVNAEWRLRTMIPAGERTALDGLFRRKRRLSQLTSAMDASLKQQQTLLEAAQKSLEIRKGELLGNAANEPIENRPEFRDGLLLVTEQTEEERNQLALEVDTLRREILNQIAERDAAIEAVQNELDKLPSEKSTAQIASRTSEQDGSE